MYNATATRAHMFEDFRTSPIDLCTIEEYTSDVRVCFLND